MTVSQSQVQAVIAEVCGEVEELLVQKNSDYGSSFAAPLGVFSGLSAEEQIDVRIDDKLRRLQHLREKGGGAAVQEDTELDLIGYLILKRVLRRLQTPEG